jgi:hypothetical protein
MPAGWFAYCGGFPDAPWGRTALASPAPMQGRRRGVTKPAGRAKRRNRKKP